MDQQLGQQKDSGGKNAIAQSLVLLLVAPIDHPLHQHPQQPAGGNGDLHPKGTLEADGDRADEKELFTPISIQLFVICMIDDRLLHSDTSIKQIGRSSVILMFRS